MLMVKKVADEPAFVEGVNFSPWRSVPKEGGVRLDTFPDALRPPSLVGSRDSVQECGGPPPLFAGNQPVNGIVLFSGTGFGTAPATTERMSAKLPLLPPGTFGLQQSAGDSLPIMVNTCKLFPPSTHQKSPGNAQISRQENDGKCRHVPSKISAHQSRRNHGN